jgi:uncharacterized protein (TIGR02117 family)
LSFLSAQDIKTISIVNHGWHTGIVIDTSDIPLTQLSDNLYFPKNRFLEFGWGDYDFYQNPTNEVDYFLAAKAMLWPTKSVMHVVGFDSDPDKFFARSGVIQLQFSDSLFSALFRYILDSFERNEAGELVALGPGLYGNSKFYNSDKTYIFPKTCNVWTAQVLKDGGLNLSPLQYQSASDLMEKLTEFGKVIRKLED